ncbi:MAG: hypothetical protein AAF581_12875 [Planctomycetota bacterium]
MMSASRHESWERRSRLWLSIAACILLPTFLGAQPTAGSPPANDKCPNAISVSDGVICFCTDFATTSDIPDTFAPVIISDYDIKADIWYCYEATCDGTAEITVSGGAGIKFAVYDGCECDGPLIEAKPECPPSGGGPTTVTIKLPVSSGQPLLIRIGHCTGKTGVGMLDITCHPGLASNDDPSCKKTIIAEDETDFEFTHATFSGQGAFPALSADLWYGYVATCDQSTTFSLCNSSPGTLVAVYIDDGTPPGVANLIASDFMSCMGAGETTAVLMPGVEYIVQVGQPQGLISDGHLLITRVPDPVVAPANDLCTAPITLMNDIPVLFDTNCASTDGAPDPLCDFFGDDDVRNDVWYCYTATCNDFVTVRILDNPYDTKLAVYDACGCPAAGVSPIACNDDGLLTDASQVQFQAMMGAMYTIRIGGAGGLTGVGEVVVTCAPPTPPPTNDLLADAIPAAVGLNAFDTRGAETDGPESCECDPKKEVWFFFTSPIEGTMRVSTCGLTNFDTYVAIYDYDPTIPGPPPVPDSDLDCDDDSDGCDLETQLRVPVLAGQTLLIRVGGFGGLTGFGEFDLFVQPIEFVRGDCNDDTLFDIADAIRGLSILFGGGTAANCDDACDANDDGAFDIADPVRVLQNLFGGLPMPIPAPHQMCGPDPTPDSLTCGFFSSCP